MKNLRLPSNLCLSYHTSFGLHFCCCFLEIQRSVIVNLPHRLHFFYFDGCSELDFKTAIVVPIHIDDIAFYPYVVNNFKILSPKPAVSIIDINCNSSLKQAVTLLLETAFNQYDCEVALCSYADFWLFPNILKYVKKDKVVSFYPLRRKPYDLTLSFIRFLLCPNGYGWSAIFSIPKKIWEKIKDQYDGTDTSIHKAVGRFNYDTPKRWLCYALRPYEKNHTSKLLRTFPLWKRIMWRMLRLGIGG